MRNDQYRTFDLKGKPWSRYLLYNKIDGSVNVPGPRVLTKKAQIKPYNMIEATGGLRFERNGVHAECGYHVWAKGRETLKLVKHFKPQYGIAGSPVLPTGVTSALPPTANSSTIAFQGPTDLNPLNPLTTLFIPIEHKDIELQTGCSPAAITHMVYGSGSYTFEAASTDIMVSCGFYGEIPQYSSSLGSWGIWAKVGFYI